MEFSDGSQLDIPLVKSAKPQSVAFEPKRVRSLVLKDLIQVMAYQELMQQGERRIQEFQKKIRTNERKGPDLGIKGSDSFWICRRVDKKGPCVLKYSPKTLGRTAGYG